MSTVREVFGAASFAGIPIAFLESYKIEFLVKAPGGMLVYGLLIALVSIITRGKAPLKKEFSCAGCPSAEHCHSGMCQNKKEDK
jgi:electron transport complex protein RnfE